MTYIIKNRKNNWGNLQFADYELKTHHIQWINALSEMFDGLDITALDVLHLKDGRDIVLEMNDTACVSTVTSNLLVDTFLNFYYSYIGSNV